MEMELIIYKKLWDFLLEFSCIIYNLRKKKPLLIQDFKMTINSRLREYRSYLNIPTF
jgi:hypothetical protein